MLKENPVGIVLYGPFAIGTCVAVCKYMIERTIQTCASGIIGSFLGTTDKLSSLLHLVFNRVSCLFSLLLSDLFSILLLPVEE